MLLPLYWPHYPPLARAAGAPHWLGAFQVLAGAGCSDDSIVSSGGSTLLFLAMLFACASVRLLGPLYLLSARSSSPLFFLKAAA